MQNGLKSTRERGKKEMNEKIDILQHNLRWIRMILGMSAEEFAGYLGMGFRTIYNWETGETSMKKIHYCAIMYVLEHEIFPERDEATVAKVELLLSILMKEVFTEMEKNDI